MVRILVTGCAGHLGSHLIPALEAAGHEVRGVDVVPTEREGDLVADLCEEGVASQLLEGIQVAIHTAAIHPWKPYSNNQYLDNNIKPTHHILKGAVERGVSRVVYTSSIAAIGYLPDPADMPLPESVRATPGELYGCTKWFGEVLCQAFSRSHGLQTVCLRPPAFMPKPELEQGLGLLGTWADVSDIVSAHVAAVSAPMPTLYEPFWTTTAMPYAASEALELRQSPATVVERYWPGAPAWFEARGLSIPPIPAIYDTSRSRDILGWEPRYTFDVWWSKRGN